MNNGKRYITPFTINVPSEVVDFLKECDDNGLDLYEIVDSICSDRSTTNVSEVEAVIAYEVKTRL